MPDTAKPYEFSGFIDPNTTPVPDVVFDELLERLNNGELRVLLYIIRRTYGFKKQSDNIAMSQMVHGLRRKDGTYLDRGTGMSKASVARAVKSLIARRIIISQRNRSAVRGDEPTTYALRFKANDPRLTSETPLPVSPADPPVSHQRTPQETVIQQTDSSNIRTAAQKRKTALVGASEQTQAAELTSADAPQLGITDGRGGSPKPVGELLNRYRQHKLAIPEEADERAAITATIRTLAPELGDKAPVRSSVNHSQ